MRVVSACHSHPEAVPQQRRPSGPRDLRDVLQLDAQRALHRRFEERRCAIDASARQRLRPARRVQRSRQNNSRVQRVSHERLWRSSRVFEGNCDQPFIPLSGGTELQGHRRRRRRERLERVAPRDPRERSNRMGMRVLRAERRARPFRVLQQ